MLQHSWTGQIHAGRGVPWGHVSPFQGRRKGEGRGRTPPPLSGGKFHTFPIYKVLGTRSVQKILFKN